ncbi:MAG: hypothetical protein ABIB79_03065 [archaeon]
MITSQFKDLEEKVLVKIEKVSQKKGKKSKYKKKKRWGTIKGNLWEFGNDDYRIMYFDFINKQDNKLGKDYSVFYDARDRGYYFGDKIAIAFNDLYLNYNELQLGKEDRCYYELSLHGKWVEDKGHGRWAKESGWTEEESKKNFNVGISIPQDFLDWIKKHSK